MSITAGTDHATIARVSIDRAQALRDQAASLRSPALAPLRAALHVRAGELELAAAALDQPVAEPTRHLQAIA